MSPKKSSNIPLWAIILGFMLFPPIGFVLLFLSLAGVQVPTKGRSAESYVNTYRVGPQRQTPSAGAQKTTQAGQSAAQNGTAQAAGAAAAAPKRTLKRFFKQPKSGKGMTIAGAIISFVFSIGFVEEFIENIPYGLLTFADEWFPLLGFMCAGLVLLAAGITKSRRAARAKLYQNVIGQRNSIFLDDLAATAGVSKAKVIEDLQKMFSDGTLPSGYLDRATDRLVLTDLGYTPAEAQTGPVERSQPTQTQTASAQPKEDPDKALLRQIRQVNDAIPDPEMTRKIARIEEITGRILAYQKNNPAKAPELRQFLNYYLPTTLKILNAYAQMDAQGIEGENISASKRRIEGMMDKVVEGFEKQLDQLFKTDAMDIATDVEVLERMLDKDGLGSGLTMGGT